MAKYIIDGNTPLKGDVNVPGNKNAVLPAMAASILTDEPLILHNVPAISDVSAMGLILQDLGARVEGTKTRRLTIKAANLKPKQPDSKLVANLRASILFLGPLLARFGRVTLRHPGGDIIGRRSINQHLFGLSLLGANVEKSGIVNTLTAKKLIGSKVYLEEASVTATENLMMAAALAKGATEIINAASEPHVYCLGELINEMGGKISGHGSNLIRIEGVDRLRGADHWVRPDHIEAGTWVAAAAATGGELVIHGVIEDDMLPIMSVFKRMGVEGEFIKCQKHAAPPNYQCARVRRGQLTAVRKIQSGVWPGFPTDLMSPVIVLATQCRGTTLAHDWMYEGRMFFVDRLIKMGANIIAADPHRVIISGPTPLFGRQTSGPDIRAGIALVIAALAASGRSEINMVELIDRGYERLDSRLASLGAKLRRIN